MWSCALVILAVGAALAQDEALLESRDVNPSYGQRQVIRQQTSPIQRFCDGKDNKAFSDGCSNAYRWCWDGVESAHNCPEGLFFDEERGACDMEMNVFECSGQRVNFEQDAVAQTVDFSCPSDGLFSGYGERQCLSEFLHCSNGIAYKKSCDDDLAFDPENQVCARPEHIAVCGGNPEELSPPEIEFNCPAPTGYFPHPSVLCSRVHFQCQDGVAVERKFCEEDELFDETERICRPAAQVPNCDFDCDTRETGVYSVGCSQDYWWCWDHRATKHRCPEGFYFNAENGQCAEFQQVFECSGERTPIATTQAAPLRPANFDCFGLQDGDYPHEQQNGYTCNKDFVKCANGGAFLFSCPPGLDFDPVERFCQPKQNILACGGSPPTEFTPEKATFECPSPNGYFAHPTQLCSATHFECQDNKAKTKVCAKGEVFDESDGFCKAQSQVAGCDFSCAGRDNGAFSEGCSNNYWACWDEQATKIACPHRLFFDQERGLCDVRPTVFECTGVRFTPTVVRAGPRPETVDFDCSSVGDGDHAIPNAGCTADFVKCAHDIPYKFSCPDQLRFSSAVRDCASPADIPECQRQQDAPVTRRTYGQAPTTQSAPVFRRYGSAPTTTQAAPVTTTQAPRRRYSLSRTTTQAAPVFRSYAPVTTQAPTTTQAAPVFRSYAPASTTTQAAPVFRSYAPVTTRTPTTTTQAAPVFRSYRPAPTTRASPVFRGYAPAPVTTQAPTTTTQAAPVFRSYAPAPTTQAAPVFRSYAPATTTQAAPVFRSYAPATTTQAPTTTQAAPVFRSYAPAATTQRTPVRGYGFFSFPETTETAPVIPIRRFRPVSFRPSGYSFRRQ